ncbi:hypothetical protein M3Y99_01274700 [Aphelenchoides fujianensis]|nr:hypothetical protein M3Y99_01274700 [Aphelenchoides fujianensis]
MMVNWKLAVLLLAVVVAVSALNEDKSKHHLRAARSSVAGRGPSPDHEASKPFEFLDKESNHKRVARGEHEPGTPFEFLGTGDEHQSRDARQVRSGEKDFAGEHGSGHRVARGIASGRKH